MTSSAAVVLFEDAAYDRLLHRAREHGLSLAEGRALEWLLSSGEVGRPQPSKGAAQMAPAADDARGKAART